MALDSSEICVRCCRLVLVHPHRMLRHKHPKIHKSHNIFYHKSKLPLSPICFPISTVLPHFGEFRPLKSLWMILTLGTGAPLPHRTPNLTALVAHIIGIDDITSPSFVLRRAARK
ncbi:hypothetical protein TcCL_NonESM09103 [Trypanosoma cruzi]|nr:hypothetical protein TcCL_NonESM09103 [Trypanosoma cruzi]